VKSFKMLTHTRVKPAKCQKTNCLGFIQICSSPRFSWCFGGFSNEAARLLSPIRRQYLRPLSPLIVSLDRLRNTEYREVCKSWV
jgi:hypothetical protein